MVFNSSTAWWSIGLDTGHLSERSAIEAEIKLDSGAPVPLFPVPYVPKSSCICPASSRL